MLAESKRFQAIVLMVAIWLVGCQPGLPDIEPTLEPVGTAAPLPDHLNLTVHSVTVGDEIGDRVGDGELYFELLVIRSEGDSRTLRAPGQKTYKVSGQDVISLDGYSLNVHNVGDDEQLFVYLMAFDHDELSFAEGAGSTVALNGAVEILEAALRQGYLAAEVTSHANLFAFVVASAASIGIDWWEQAEVLGGYYMLLEPGNNWHAGNRFIAGIEDGNLEVDISFLAVEASEVAQPMATSSAIASEDTPNPVPTATYEVVEDGAIVEPSFDCLGHWEDCWSYDLEARTMTWQGATAAPFNIGEAGIALERIRAGYRARFRTEAPGVIEICVGELDGVPVSGDCPLILPLPAGDHEYFASSPAGGFRAVSLAAIDPPLRTHTRLAVGDGPFAQATVSDGLASYTEAQLWEQGKFGDHQRIRREEHPNGCATAFYTVDKLWISGTPGMQIAIDGRVVGTYTAQPDPHGYIFEWPVVQGQEICARNAGPEEFHIVLGPDIYNHYDTYCFRGSC